MPEVAGRVTPSKKASMLKGLVNSRKRKLTVQGAGVQVRGSQQSHRYKRKASLKQRGSLGPSQGLQSHSSVSGAVLHLAGLVATSWLSTHLHGPALGADAPTGLQHQRPELLHQGGWKEQPLGEQKRQSNNIGWLFLQHHASCCSIVHHAATYYRRGV